jgi:hypothetical protein
VKRQDYAGLFAASINRTPSPASGDLHQLLSISIPVKAAVWSEALFVVVRDGLIRNSLHPGTLPLLFLA